MFSVWLYKLHTWRLHSWIKGQSSYLLCFLLRRKDLVLLYILCGCHPISFLQPSEISGAFSCRVLFWVCQTCQPWSALGSWGTFISAVADIVLNICLSIIWVCLMFLTRMDFPCSYWGVFVFFLQVRCQRSGITSASAWWHVCG